MTITEKKQLAKIVYEFIELKTRYNSMVDADVVANNASDLFNTITKKFKLKKEIIEIIKDDDNTDDEDKAFLIDYV